MKDVGVMGGSSAPIPWLYILLFLGVLSLIAFGWKRLSNKK